MNNIMMTCPINSENSLQNLLYQQNATSFNPHHVVIDYTVSGNCLNQRIDGSFELIPKSPAYIFGERVVRPALDASAQIGNHVYSLLKVTLKSVNSVITRIFDFIPVAQAAEIEHETQEKIASTPEEMLSLSLPLKVNDSIETFQHFLDVLTTDQKREFRENFSAVREMNFELLLYLKKKNLEHKEFKAHIDSACSSYKHIRETLSFIVDDLQANLENSKYSPTSHKEIVLMLPVYTNDFQHCVKKGKILEDKAIISVILKSETLNESKETNFIYSSESQLIEHINQMNQLFQPFNLLVDSQDRQAFNILLQFYSKERINSLKTQLKALKDKFELSLNQVKESIISKMTAYEQDVQQEILHQIHLIYVEHENIARSQQDKAEIRLAIEQRQVQTGYVIGWETIELGYFYNSRLFKFLIANYDLLKDEL